MKPYKSVRIFKNDLLERLTHVHPITPLVLWAPMIAWLVWRSLTLHGMSVLTVGLMGAAAILVWTLTEYLLHRFAFHFPAQSKLGERVVFLIHGLHHDDPIDPTRLVMPPFPAIVFAAILYSLFRAILGPVWVEPFFAFFLLGYLWYDYTHFAVHHFTPKTKFGRMLKQHHMLHHYVSSEIRMGVSTPLWDYVFGTLKEAPKKGHAV